MVGRVTFCIFRDPVVSRPRSVLHRRHRTSPLPRSVMVLGAPELNQERTGGHANILCASERRGRSRDVRSGTNLAGHKNVGNFGGIAFCIFPDTVCLFVRSPTIHSFTLLRDRGPDRPSSGRRGVSSKAERPASI